MVKYRVIKEFTASQFTFDRPNPNPQVKNFKVGDEIYVTETMDFGLFKHFVSDGFNVSLSNLQFISNEKKPISEVASRGSITNTTYRFIKDVNIPYKIPPSSIAKLKPFKKGDIIEGGTFFKNNTISTTLDGKMPHQGMEGEIWLSIPRENLEPYLLVENQPQKYIFTKDFTANRKSLSDPMLPQPRQHISPKQFKKGDIVEGLVQKDYQGKNHIITGDYDISGAVEPYTDTKIQSSSNSDIKSTTVNKVGIIPYYVGLLIFGGITYFIAPRVFKKITTDNKLLLSFGVGAVGGIVAVYAYPKFIKPTTITK